MLHGTCNEKSSWEGVHERLHAAAFCQLDEEAAHLAAAIQQKPATQAAQSALSVRRPAVWQAGAMTPLPLASVQAQGYRV